MTKLSDTQAIILSATAQRDDGAVLPLPESLRIKGGAVDKVLRSLKAKGLIEHQGTARGDDPSPLRITRAGLQATGVEIEADTPEGATSADAGAPATKAGRVASPAKRKATAAKRGKAASAEKPTPCAGTKQAQMIEMLKRHEGATVEQIADVTGWQKHTIRGAISGALKKKLGFTIEARRSAPTSVVGAGSQARDTREVGPNRMGAKGSSTVYRIIGADPTTE